MTEHCESLGGNSFGETVRKGVALRRTGRITTAEVRFQSALIEQPRPPTHCIDWASFEPRKPSSAVRFNCCEVRSNYGRPTRLGSMIWQTHCAMAVIYQPALGTTRKPLRSTRASRHATTTWALHGRGGARSGRLFGADTEGSPYLRCQHVDLTIRKGAATAAERRCDSGIR